MKGRLLLTAIRYLVARSWRATFVGSALVLLLALATSLGCTRTANVDSTNRAAHLETTRTVGSRVHQVKGVEVVLLDTPSAMPLGSIIASEDVSERVLFDDEISSTTWHDERRDSWAGPVLQVDVGRAGVLALARLREEHRLDAMYVLVRGRLLGAAEIASNGETSRLKVPVRGLPLRSPDKATAEWLRSLFFDDSN